jgi:hypothetical protein
MAKRTKPPVSTATPHPLLGARVRVFDGHAWDDAGWIADVVDGTAGPRFTVPLDNGGISSCGDWEVRVIRTVLQGVVWLPGVGWR